MATFFEVRVAGEDRLYAAQAVAAAFAALDRLEALLSRFAEESEVSRIGRLRDGESLRLSEETFGCLDLAIKMQRLTGGAFDPFLAQQWGRARAGREPDFLQLSPDCSSIVCGRGPIHLDLGAIGKGFALDQMALILQDWEISKALLVAGGSSLLALDAPEGTPGWEIGLSDGHAIWLRHAALSCSGISVQGEHIMDPATGRAAAGPYRAWALTDTAAMSDALSTAWMILPLFEIERICQELPARGVVQLSREAPQDLITIPKNSLASIRV